MRDITRKATEAFLKGAYFKNSNTIVENNAMYLFGNKIAEFVNGDLYIDTCGWLSNTTKERLNGLPNVSISQVKGIWYLNGAEWDGKRINVSYRFSRRYKIDNVLDN